VRLPLPADSVLSKPDAQEVLHAVEELYYFGRWDEAAAFVARVLESARTCGADSERGGGLDEDTFAMLEEYERRIARRLGMQ